jgi:hypothetical protein
LRVAGVAASLLALVVSGFTGGLEPAAPPGPPLVEQRAVNEGLPWNVTVTGAGYASNADPLRPEKAGDHWVAVGVTIEITSDETRSDLRDAVRLVGIPGLREKRPSNVLLARDDTQSPELHPGLPEKLTFFWELAGDAAIPVEADVQIVGKTLRKDSLTGHANWLDDAVRAHVVLPIQNLDQ